MAGKRIFMTAAETSGDQHAAEVARELRKLDPSILIEGHGGAAMAAAGVKIHTETVQSAAMGWQGALRALEIFKLLKWTRAYFDSHTIDLLICVDSPAMNFHFAKLAHERGVPVLYYIAPQLWAWREGRIKKLQQWVDRVACILPFEEPYFQKHGVAATYVGHPLFDEINRNGNSVSEDGIEHHASPDHPPYIGIVTGSRVGEVKANFPGLLDVTKQIRIAFPKSQFFIPTTSATHRLVCEMLDNTTGLGARAIFTVEQDAFDQLIPKCDLVITKSGTSTLHVAAHHVPMIVVYRANPILWHLVGRWMIRTRTFALVNVLAESLGAQGHVVPEFIPWFGDAESVSAKAIEMLRKPEQLEIQKMKLAPIVKSIDQPGASINTAKLALSMMR